MSKLCHALNLEVVLSVLFTCINCFGIIQDCQRDCTAISSVGEVAKCRIQANSCLKKSNLTIGGVSAPSLVESGWYLYHENDHQFIALNFSWAVNQDLSLLHLKGYELSIYGTKQDGAEQGLISHETFFCIDTNLTVADHGSLAFYYDCYGRSASTAVSPNDFYEIYVAPIPKQLSRNGLEDMRLDFSIEIPSCINQRLSKLKACQNSVEAVRYICKNRTILINYTLSTSLGSSAIVLLCHQLNPNISKCQKVVSSTSGQPMSKSALYIQIPPNYDLFDSFSVEVFGNRNYQKRQRTKITFVGVCPSDSESSLSLYIIITVFILVFVAVTCFLLWFYKSLVFNKWMKNKACLSQPTAPDLNFSVVESRKINTVVSVYIVFVDDHPKHTDVVIKFASFLQKDLGFDVIFEMWDSENVYRNCTSWIESSMAKANKIIVIWSPGAKIRWEQHTYCYNIQTDLTDLFTPVVMQIKKDLLRNQNMGKYFFAYFEYCSESDIPEVFREQLFCQFRLMQHIEKLYFLLTNVEKYQPGFELKQDKVAFNSLFDLSVNELGPLLRSSIVDMCTYVKDNPMWHVSKKQGCKEMQADVKEQLIADVKKPVGSNQSIRSSSIVYHCDDAYTQSSSLLPGYVLEGDSIYIEDKVDGNHGSEESFELGHELESSLDNDGVASEEKACLLQSSVQSCDELLAAGAFSFKSFTHYASQEILQTDQQFCNYVERGMEEGKKLIHSPQLCLTQHGNAVKDTDPVQESKSSETIVCYNGAAEDSGVLLFQVDAEDCPRDNLTDKHDSAIFFKDCEFVCPSPILCPEHLQLAMLDMSSDPWQSLATLNFETIN